MLRSIKIIAALSFFLLSLILSYCQSPKTEENVLESDSLQVAPADSIDQMTGLVIDDALPLIKGNCTACHSAKLITQNRASREGWKSMIVWMQQTQKLWDLGENEDKILDYLAEHYAPDEVGRRQNLQNIEWYDLE